MRIESITRDSDGTLPAYVWPGGYPVVYVFKDSESCCPKCANTEPLVWIAPKEGRDTKCSEDAQWQLTGWFIHYEGEPEVCANCHAKIESAYGVPDTKEKT